MSSMTSSSAKSERSVVLAKSETSGPSADVSSDESSEIFTPAELRPGQILLLEFSRYKISEAGNPEEDDSEESTGKKRKKRGKNKEAPSEEDAADIYLADSGQKVVNAAYIKMGKRFAALPWGYFCENHEVDEARDALAITRKMAMYANKVAMMKGNPRRIRIDLYPTPLLHDSLTFRTRTGEFIAKLLIELRESYTTKTMWSFRVNYMKAKFLDRMIVPNTEQAKVIRRALVATKAQRPVMIAIYGDKIPMEYLDPETGGLRSDVRLDFTDIDRAIKQFYPSWTPPGSVLAF